MSDNFTYIIIVWDALPICDSSVHVNNHCYTDEELSAQ